MKNYLLRRECIRMGNDGKLKKEGKMVREDGMLKGNIRYREKEFREGMVDRK